MGAKVHHGMTGEQCYRALMYANVGEMALAALLGVLLAKVAPHMVGHIF